jgi:hypothetical protein
MSDIDPGLVQQRIRNRIYEYLGGVVEFSAARGTWDLSDAVNEWQMYVDDPFVASAFSAPAFTPAEVVELSLVHSAWNAFANAAHDMSDEERCMRLSEWSHFVTACARAEGVFAARGRLSEDTLVGHDA